MRLKLIPVLIFALLLAFSGLPAYSQAAAPAELRGLPLVVGAGMADYNIDWYPGQSQRMEGISAWADFYPRDLPRKIDGLGIEVAGHDINFGRPADLSKMRQDTILGGVIYAWNRFPNFHPYGKFLVGIGSIDFPTTPPSTYSHDTFPVFAPGGGAEYRVWRRIWVRGDYEYQIWHHTFGPSDLTPNGFSIGASYDLRPIRHE